MAVTPKTSAEDSDAAYGCRRFTFVPEPTSPEDMVQRGHAAEPVEEDASCEAALR